MADLKLGTQIGGNLVWHQGILELNPVDDKLNYQDQEIMTTRGNQTLLGTTNFNVGGSKYDLVSMPTQAKNTKSFLRKFRSGDTDTIWHETVQGSVYRISTGNTDSDLVMQLSGTGAIFEEAVLTNAAQSSASNSFTRKDFVNAEDAKKVNKSGDGMTGNLDFNLDNQGIRVKFPGGSVANNCGVFGGKGDAALKDKTNININSWYGVGFSPTVGVGKAVADGENSIWFNLRSGNMYTVGRLFVDEDKEVYSSVNKPTPGDLNAYTKAEVNDKQFIRVKDERVTMSGPSGQGNREFSSFFTNKTDVSTGWVSGFTIKGWDGTYASWSLFAGSRSDVDQNQLWFRHGRSTWLPSSRIYHEQDKPTNVELNLVSRDGDTMTGTLNINVTDAYKLGTPHSINLNNGSLGGINMLAFNDPSDVDNEGILFPKTGKNGNSNVQADYDILRALDGKLLFNSRETYGEWNKPTADDVQAIADVRTVLSVDLDSVVIPGSYFQSANVNATPKKHYPVELAGTLFVIRSANGVQQEYTTFTGRKFTRGRSSTGWLEWKEFYGEAYPVQFVDKKGDTMTGTLKVPNIVIESTYDNMLTLNCTDDGPNYIAFQRSGDNRFFIRQATTGNIATDRLDFLSGVKTDGGAYIAPLWIDSNGVYTNVPQKDASNALTRKDYVDQKVGTAVQSVTATGAVKSTGGINPVISLINATNKIDGAMSAADKAKLDGLPSAAVNKTGDTLSGSMIFNNDSQLVWSRNTDWAKIGFKNDSDSDADSFMWFEAGDNGNEYFKFRSRSGTTNKDILDLRSNKAEFHIPIVADGVKNAINVHGRGSISFADASNTRFHLWADGNAFRLNHGVNAETNIISVLPDGNTSSIGSFTAKDFIQTTAQSTNVASCTRKDYVDAQVGAVDAKNVAKAGDTMTGVLAVAANAQIGASANGAFGSSSITGLLNSFIEVVTPNSAEGNSAGGIVFHNRGTSTSALYYKNDNSNDGYFNFKSDDLRYDVRVNGNKVYHQGFKPTAAEVGAAPVGFGLGTYGTGISTVLGDCNLRRQSGFFQGSNIAGIPNGAGWTYLFNQAHGNAAGYFGYLAINFAGTKAWIGGQEGGTQKGPYELVKQYDRFVANNAVGNDFHQCAIEVNGNTAIDSRPGIGFHMSGRFAGTLHLWEAGDFRFHTQGLASYAGITTGNVNANDVYIRSDIRLKRNLVRVTGALDKTCSLTAYSYDKKQTLKSTDYDKHEVGLIAQDVEKVLPAAISYIEDSDAETGATTLMISNSAVTALLVEAIKELTDRVKYLESKLN
ncbi:hypothetical protein ASfcp2_233 [Aeromonas phage AsFcp_2]|nr:hypothetical protein ASfcp2_233 [Aeromonas phage AsFcp_2]